MQFDQLLYENNETIKDIIVWKDYFVGYFLSKNKKKSSANEDTLFIKRDENVLLFGVADGAGGHPRGKDAAFICAEEVVGSSFRGFIESPLSSIEKVNEKIIALKVGARTTFSLGTLEGDDLKCYCVGDSEIIYWNRLGNELYSSIPHSEVGYKIEAGVINQEDALDDENRYIVNNLMGDSTIRIEATSKMVLKKGHTVLIGSDGLFDNISHEQLKEMIFPGDIKESFEKLSDFLSVQDPKNWKKDDDISFVLLRKISS